jgi:bifunctional UDP-N-acetylglucosamine pyrophosphorylase/glucosamine-1-phosphate N-acetyltransferase
VKASRKKKAGSSRGRASSPLPGKELSVIILAAGAGTRMRSTLPKMLHRVGGRSLIESVLAAVQGISAARVVVVLGASHRQVEPELAGRATPVRQAQPRGTADAVREALGHLPGGEGSVLVLSAAVPLIHADTLRRLLDRQQGKRRDLAFLTFRPPDPTTLSRVLRDSGGGVRAIARAAAIKERRMGEASAGIYCFRRGALENALAGLRVNRLSGELELADTVEILARRRGAVEAIGIDWREAWVVHTRRDLAAVEEILHRRGIERALDGGVTLIDPSTTRIGPHVTLEPDTVIHPFVMLEGRTALSSGCEVFSFTRIADSQVASSAVIGPHCDVEGARIGERARVGPFARLRPGTVLAEDVRVGNFVETKEASLGRGVKALHHSYLGDAEIGADANIGAGVITCNFDGRTKNRTVVGPGAFVGSDTQLIAPVTVGEGAYIGAGSTITEDVPPGALALTRVAQKNEPGWVERRKKRNGRAVEEEGKG